MSSRPFKILALGEVLWDLLPDGPVLGGAPANFACHAGALGADSTLVSRIGNDPLGREILARFKASGFSTDFISVDPTAPTGSVSVEVGSDGQPNYVIHENVAWDSIPADLGALEAAAQADAICFGSLAQRSEGSRKAIRALVCATKASAWRVFDINLRQSFYSKEIIEESLTLANVLKLNETELPVLADLLSLTGDTPRQLDQLAHRFGLRAVVYTRGAAGSILLANHIRSEHPGIFSIVRDTIGAGDAFTATVVLGLLYGWPLEKINQSANEVAAFVCSQSGATPPLPDRFRLQFWEGGRVQ
jgi:fructokinase